MSRGPLAARDVAHLLAMENSVNAHSDKRSLLSDLGDLVGRHVSTGLDGAATCAALMQVAALIAVANGAGQKTFGEMAEATFMTVVESLKREAAVIDRSDPQFDFRWRVRTRFPERFGQRCRVLVRGAMNSATVQFEDGFEVVTSRNYIRKVKDGE